MVKIIVDGFGGDNSPQDVVSGAVEATKRKSDLRIVLTGKKEVLVKLLEEKDYNPDKFEIIDAPEVIEVDAVPTVEFKTKPDSSMVKAFEFLRKEDDIQGLVSAGSSGAVLVGGLFKLGRIHGISRPAFCPLLPTFGGNTVLLCDSGANIDCKPSNLGDFAIMAREYAKIILNLENPRVGLLNIGVEAEKGNIASKEYYEYLSQMRNINFVGNIEGHDMMADKCDVLVTDGFGGNIALKSAEGGIKLMAKVLKTKIKDSFWGKIGAVTLMRGSLKKLKNHLENYTEKGAILLGCKKLVIKAHGNSSSSVFCNTILQAAEMAEARLCDKIEQVFKENKTEE